ncbi:unnamed protein product, partial [Effrenium voratum]
AHKAAAENEGDEDDCAETPAAVLTNSESELDEEEFQRAMEAQLAANELPVSERPVREADACSSDASAPPSPLGTLEDRDLGTRLWARRAANKKRNKAAVPGPRHVTSVSWQTVRGELH